MLAAWRRDPKVLALDKDAEARVDKVVLAVDLGEVHCVVAARGELELGLALAHHLDEPRAPYPAWVVHRHGEVVAGDARWKRRGGRGWGWRRPRWWRGRWRRRRWWGRRRRRWRTGGW